MLAESKTNIISNCIREKYSSDNFNKLYKVYHNQVYFLAMKILRNESDARDVVQETFIYIYNNIDKLKDINAFNSWMNRIVVGCCSKLIRKNKKMQYVDDYELVDGDFMVNDSDDTIPEVSIEKNEKKELLMRLLNKLSPKKREVMILYYYNNMKIGDIAKVLDAPEGTIKTRLKSAKSDLEKYIKEDVKFSTLNSINIPLIMLLMYWTKNYLLMSRTHSDEIFNNISKSLDVPLECQRYGSVSKVNFLKMSVVVGLGILAGIITINIIPRGDIDEIKINDYKGMSILNGDVEYKTIISKEAIYANIEVDGYIQPKRVVSRDYSFKTISVTAPLYLIALNIEGNLTNPKCVVINNSEVDNLNVYLESNKSNVITPSIVSKGNIINTVDDDKRIFIDKVPKKTEKGLNKLELEIDPYTDSLRPSNDLVYMYRSKLFFEIDL